MLYFCLVVTGKEGLEWFGGKNQGFMDEEAEDPFAVGLIGHSFWMPLDTEDKLGSVILDGFDNAVLGSGNDMEALADMIGMEGLMMVRIDGDNIVRKNLR